MARSKKQRDKKKASERKRSEHARERRARKGSDATDAFDEIAPPQHVENAEGPFTLSLDIGGTAIKTLVLDRDGAPVGGYRRHPTPRPAKPARVLATVEAMLLEEVPYERVSVGFPGVVVRGLVKTAPNLDTTLWSGFDLARAVGAITHRPTRAINDADMLGLGAIAGRGVELVLTLGTGLGSALFVDGHLVPNLELGHHPFKKGKTYEEWICDTERKRIGRTRFRGRVDQIIAQLTPIVNYEHLHLGGGNARLLDPASLPDNITIFGPVAGMRGGIRLWTDPP